MSIVAAGWTALLQPLALSVAAQVAKFSNRLHLTKKRYLWKARRKQWAAAFWYNFAL